ncbi:Protein A52 [Monkeypox virus]|uniref:Bifunctional Toll/IL1-receptor protein/[TIR]-like suppresses TIR-dependent signal transduction n=1 Tax=Monkeypox virus TaxID=10244 RepID=Q3I7Z8_MONPV|nr:bifunctional Toll/IL1-receptor protein/[TIR]-like suppresses TIR-dependent signal transduction [Monkeypox virus]AAY97566.1 bifunctional Toll/IL1-receptor protein/[TIR]-like suppresses TIR-dependent signal transduction [Monkeypox virus]AAY97765.1 bifunctional Toll/IL1-receptor protein/[TIR]-like suppresses TIR-dependent signal transduction [Monkeypox virus]QGQ59893.1 hypothetical protein PDLMKLCO_00173 [Monkeypox virus]URK21231.1 bifunctional Toll/IL1-receptor protein/[TIR]-like suppresses TI
MNIKIDILVFLVINLRRLLGGKMKKEKISTSPKRKTTDVIKPDYLEYNDLLDRDEMSTILEEY